MTKSKWYDPGDHLPWLLPSPQPQPTALTTDRTQLALFPQQDTHKND